MSWSKSVAAAVGLTAASISSATLAQTERVVETGDGKIAGTVEGAQVSYLGIPYAAPPVGPLRWREPKPVEKWTGVKQTKKFGATCWQPNAQWRQPGDPPLSEDCLYLNVWAPADAKPGAKLPVMVWIHGGGWETGSGSLRPDYPKGYTSEGVVIVSMNYRLGRFGVFAHPLLSAEQRDEMTANYGFLDTIQSLRWVQENIAAFGGDPENVTIFGISAGGGSVNMLSALPVGKGLFRRAIAQSPGSYPAVSPLAAADAWGGPSAESVGEKWAASVGATDLASLRALSPDVILQPGRIRGGAVIDGKLVPGSIEPMFAAGKINPEAYLTGATSYEGSVFAVYNLDMSGVFKLLGDKADAVRALYDADDKTAQIRLAGDLLLLAGSRTMAGQVATKTKRPAYLYYFDYVAEGQRPKPGASHGDDSYFTFNTFSVNHPLLPQIVPTKLDHSVAATFHSYWVNFAKTGNPNGPGLPEWPRYDPASDLTMNFSPEGPKVGPHPQEKRTNLIAPTAASGPMAF